ncbi:TraR/DksA C4-type zinc finger protein [bacterium]|nr:TraR/DksA C4-type zinc finger protein [bacterium]
MNEDDKKFYEKRLLEERQKILNEMGHFDKDHRSNIKESSGDLSAYSFHMADQASDADAQEKAFQRASKGGRLLYHIDEALRRLYADKDYGLCHSCGKPIQRKRLEAVPHARLCIDCKSKEENGI